ncbi:MAG TPA: prepilin-type N-terminal cleavage/methylation domain-containing protein [Sulfuricurvum sp.]|nr:prepilin-type N-terminal cleavage/methylation domain-containing protein [Sulfuricurvum sp.]
MACSNKGFSLIETLVAVMIASVAALALLQVVSNASRTSEHLLSRFESSLVMGLAVGMVTEDMHAQTMSVSELLQTRYKIDHPSIQESLNAFTYEIYLFPLETIDPFTTMINATNVTDSIAVGKGILKNDQESRPFFRLWAGEKL